MKKLTILFISMLALVMTGCEESTKEQRDAEIATRIKEFSYKGHDYLLYERAYNNGGVAGLAHDPDCPCMEKGGEE